MATQPYLLGIDQGTSGSRALLMDSEGQLHGYGYCPLPRLYPRPGWVEQDPDTLVEGVATAISEAIAQAGCRPGEPPVALPASVTPILSGMRAPAVPWRMLLPGKICGPRQCWPNWPPG